MRLTNEVEIINYPCASWTDPEGNTYPWPQLAFLLKRGFTIVAEEEATLEERQVQVWALIKEHRDTLEDGGVLVAGKWWHTDIKSRAKYLGLMMMGAAVAGIQWKTMDGTMQVLNQTLVAQVFQGVAVADTTNFANAETHRVAMTQVTEPEQYDFSTGWTGSYQG